MMTPTLFSLAMDAPLVAVNPDDVTVLHAATMEATIHGFAESDGDGPPDVTTACGLDGHRLFAIGDVVLPWPPSVRSIKPWTRCRECFEATSERRPRCELRRVDA